VTAAIIGAIAGLVTAVTGLVAVIKRRRAKRCAANKEKGK
jgi:hypothetical protein